MKKGGSQLDMSEENLGYIRGKDIVALWDENGSEWVYQRKMTPQYGRGKMESWCDRGEKEHHEVTEEMALRYNRVKGYYGMTEENYNMMLKIKGEHCEAQWGMWSHGVIEKRASQSGRGTWALWYNKGK